MIELVGCVLTDCTYFCWIVIVLIIKILINWSQWCSDQELERFWKFSLAHIQVPDSSWLEDMGFQVGFTIYIYIWMNEFIIIRSFSLLNNVQAPNSIVWCAFLKCSPVINSSAWCCSLLYSINHVAEKGLVSSVLFVTLIKKKIALFKKKIKIVTKWGKSIVDMILFFF